MHRRQAEPEPIDVNRPGTDPDDMTGATVPAERAPDGQEAEAHPS